MLMSSSRTAHMSALADELAKSGHYRGWAEIEFELRDRGYPEAENWLLNPWLRRRISSICDLARARVVTKA